METFFRDIELHNEAYMVEHNLPCKRRFTHDELQPAIAAIRELEAAKLKVPTAAEIDAAMMEIIK
jgi:uncharacterized protein (UPF0216 family)